MADQETMKNFLCMELEIPVKDAEVYMSKFVEHDIRRISDFKLLTDADLQDMCVKKIAHRRKIMGRANEIACDSNKLLEKMNKLGERVDKLAEENQKLKDACDSNKLLKKMNKLGERVDKLTEENQKLKESNKKQREDLDFLLVVRGYQILGEAACPIIEAYDAYEKGRTQSHSPGAKPIKRVKGNQKLPEPQADDILKRSDVENLWPTPTQDQFDTYLGNMRDSRHAISHIGKNLSPKSLKREYDCIISPMKRLAQSNVNVLKEYEPLLKKMNTTARIPSLDEVINMKPYFYQHLVGCRKRLKLS